MNRRALHCAATCRAASCQFYVGVEQMHSSHCILALSREEKFRARMPSVRNERRSRVRTTLQKLLCLVRPSSICLASPHSGSCQCRPTPRQRRESEVVACSLAVYLLSDVPSQATCTPRKKRRPIHTQNQTLSCIQGFFFSKAGDGPIRTVWDRIRFELDCPHS